MLRVAKKYSIFGNSTKAATALRQFLDNFELIQVYLGSIHEKLQNAKPDEEKHARFERNAIKFVKLLQELEADDVK
eukprot:CAMPEP_0168530796 /NCGR_PEP_ID=MMETSP0405-20121227/14940_1 /TAXON_ID=498012 /ORGANISM="Trichosphaerium sp, Strain Am-I-7 wt" /LENGTH=75 /DNA_ID=CAMNT_0008555225 /DNA_START=294 /DNA_END=518 /DNA_ORIENTATION=+